MNEERGSFTDECLIEALRIPTTLRMQYWSDALAEHSRHPTFHTEGWVTERMVGFTCSCSGEEQTWRISLATLRQQLPEARAAFQSLYSRDLLRDGIRRAKESSQANKRAKALLHRYLSREQRFDLRAHGYFMVTGQDGRAYRIKDSASQNVFLVENGVEVVRYCIVSTTIRIPTYDLMLAQKVMLECDITSFMAKAHISNIGEMHEMQPFTVLPGDLEEPILWAQRQLETINPNGDVHERSNGEPRQAPG